MNSIELLFNEHFPSFIIHNFYGEANNMIVFLVSFGNSSIYLISNFLSIGLCTSSKCIDNTSPEVCVAFDFIFDLCYVPSASNGTIVRETPLNMTEWMSRTNDLPPPVVFTNNMGAER